MVNKKILLFGGSGLLGSHVLKALSSQFHVIYPRHNEVDLLSKKSVEEKIEIDNPGIIVYAAGQTNPDIAEKEREYTKLINCEAVSYISKKASKGSIPVIYFSTNAVFKGDKSDSPYLETDSTNPVNYYGLTKLLGEKEVLNASNKNSVIRLNLLYCANFPKKSDFARNIVKKLSEKKQCVGITDQYCNPTYVDDAILILTAIIKTSLSGIFHVGSTDYLTNFELARLITKEFDYPSNLILPITLNDFFKGKIAKREHFSWLNITKTQKILGNLKLGSNNLNIKKFHNQINVL